jgi:hypothetical protein
MKRKTLTTAVLGATGLAAAGLAQAQDFSDPDSDVGPELCGGSTGNLVSDSWSYDGCDYEAEARCDGELAADAEYGVGTVCVGWQAIGEGEAMAARYYAFLADDPYHYGCTLGALGPIGYTGEYGVTGYLGKIEQKFTTEARGNGKPGHQGRKSEYAPGLTVEFEFKADCPEVD